MSDVGRIGRNDPCWCGSGRKWKLCHAGRENQERLPAGAVRHAQRQALAKKVCLHPRAPTACRGAIVHAHSISRAASLRAICVDGHAVTFEWYVNILGAEDARDKLVGIKRASTFTGFCQFHDDELFAPLEKADFVGSPEQCFLLAYRAVAMELLTKRGMLDAYPHLRENDRGMDLESQLEWQRIMSRLLRSGNKSAREFEQFKTAYDELWCRRAWTDLNRIVVRFAGHPRLVCSGTAYPEFNFAGFPLQAVRSDTVNELLTFHLVTAPEGFALVLAWHRQPNDCVGQFVESFMLLPRSAQAEAVLRLVLDYSENVFIDPKWWAQLSPESRCWMRRRHLNGMPRRSSTDLIPTGAPVSLGCIVGLDVVRTQSG